jgi:hypothetical protein
MLASQNGHDATVQVLVDAEAKQARYTYIKNVG